MFLLLFIASSMGSMQKEGMEVGRTGNAHAFSQIEHFPSQDLLPADQKNLQFDPDSAKVNNDTLDFLQSEAVQKNEMTLQEREYFLERSEQIAQDPLNLEIEEALESHLETCQQTDAPFPLSVIRDLQVEVLYDPGESKEVKVCNRHEFKKRFYYKKEAESKVSELKKTLSQDTTIRWYQIDGPKGGGTLHRYLVEAHWEHHDDAATCNYYQTQRRVLRDPSWKEIGEAWHYDNPSASTLSQTPDCTFIKSDCLDPTPSKIINGKEVHRQCWKEKLTFLCKLPNTQDCPSLKNPNCELIKKECLQEGPYGCTLWELTFKCYTKMIKRQIGECDLYGLDEEHTYEPNNSFSEIAAKLALFDEIKKDLEHSQASDARNIQIFKGKAMTCSKSIADKALYDCCFTHSGLAKDLGLSHCSADEIALAEMREQGLCHYLGSYSAKFCDLWKSRDEHVFCCFGSKLARILQENAHAQLAIAWEAPEHAHCRGLSIEEIGRLDFAKMDFSELYSHYERKLPENFHTKLTSFENRLKEKVREHEQKD